MRKLVVVLALFATLFSANSVAFAGEDCEDDPRACFDGFEDDDSVITKSKKAERTFSIPPIKAGFIIDLKNRDILPHLSVEILEFELPYLGDFALDTGVATSRVFLSVTWEFIPIVKAGPSVWAGYNVRENEPAFGVGLSILDF